MWTEQTLRAAVEHGLQREAFRRVRQRLRELRSLKEPQDWYEFQRELCRDVIWAQEYKSRCSRNLKRQHAGRKPTEEPESGAWETDHRIASRVERQMRSVADAFAWRLLDCDRQVFWVLAQNASPGLMYGKKGLLNELNQVDSQWKQGRFALLNDLTLSIRIGDLTIFDGERRYLQEVKADPRKGRREQRERIARALETLNRKLPLDLAGQPHQMFTATTQLKTKLKHLAAALEQAKKNGVGASVIQTGWLVTAVSIVADAGPADDDPEAWIKWQSEWRNTAGLSSVEHRLQSMWSWLAWDLSDPLVGGVPFGAYPIHPDRCAELICGYAMFQTVISQAVVDQALKASGFKTEWYLRTANDSPDPSAPLFSISRELPDGWRSITVAANAINQILYELVEPSRYASALGEMMSWSLGNFPRQPFSGNPSVELGKSTLAFANEKAVWFKRGRGGISRPGQSSLFV